MKPRIKIVLIALAIIIISVLTIYSGTSDRENPGERNIYQRQIFWAFLGLLFFVIFANFPYRKLRDWVYVLYGAVLVLLVLVLVLGSIRMGAQRWLKLVWLNFQPSELAKLVVILFLAGYYSSKSLYSINYSSRYYGVIRGLLIPFFIVAVPILLILKQPDLGSGLMIAFVFMAMVFLAHVNIWHISGFLFLGFVLSPVFWHFLKDYQRDRLMVFINPNIDPLGAGYTVIQSKIAVGSGGFLGKGWLSGTQGQLHFLPESHTDFIFSSFAEEWGFIGCVILLSLYAYLIKTCLDISRNEHDSFGRLLAFGITSMLSIQIFVNIAMTVGLAPVVGLPLPLMSYGGSSLFITLIALGIMANIDKTRSAF